LRYERKTKPAALADPSRARNTGGGFPNIMTTDKSIALIDAASEALSKVTNLSEAVQLSNMAQAAAVYAKRAKCALPVINRAVFIKVESERKAGEFLEKMPKSKNRHSSDPTLGSLEVTNKQSSRWQRMALVPEDEVHAYFAACNERGKEAASGAIEKRGRLIAPKNGARKPEAIDGMSTDIHALVASGQKFGTIYADPPWLYSNQGTRAATSNHYGGMTVDEICALPIGELALPKSHLHLWTTNAFLFECPKIFAAWGFEFKSSFIWVKSQLGIGNYWRNSHEIMLLAVRGGQTGISKSEKSWLECSRGAHSSKPDMVRERIERLSPGPFLELFGRRAVPGWMVFGNQVIQELA
jgi:N6-adenosine-specific RNA methylase IME4